MQKTKVCFTLLFIYVSVTLVVAQINTPVAKWKFQSGSPIRGGIRADTNTLFFGNAGGYLFSVNKTSGVLNWKFKTGGAIVCKPALSDDAVIFSSRDQYVYALSRSSGKLLWKFEMQKETPHPWGWDYYTSSPVVHSGIVYIGSGDHYLYALDLKSGNVVWKFKTGNKIRATPLLHQSKLYVPSFDGVVYVLETGKGQLLWKFETEGAHLKSEDFGWDRNAVNASPSIQDSLMVFGSRDGSLYCVNIHTQQQKWKFTYGPTWVIASALIKNGMILNGWSDNSLFSSVDLQTGKENWKYDCGSFVYADAVADDQYIYTGSGNGKIFAFNMPDGKLRWEYETDGPVFCSPAIENKMLFVGSDDGNLYAFTEGRNAIRAVYTARNITGKFKQQAFKVDDKIAPYFISKGYKELDSASLITFMKERILDGLPSVIVFAHDYLPPQVAGDDPVNSLFRKYMEAGGKVVRPGQLPNFYKINEEGQFAGVDHTYAAKLLGIEVDVPFESGNYFAVSSQEGLNRGLPATFTSTNCPVSEKGIVVLASNEIGRPGAWFKKLGDKPNGGYLFVRSWGWITPIREKDLELLFKVAEYGL